MDWVLLDLTNGASTASGEKLSHADLEAIAAAVQIQLNRDVAPYYGDPGGAGHRVRAGTSSTDIQPGECVHAIVPALPAEPEAIAFHDVTGAGVPCSFDAISLNDTILGQGNSLAVSTSHELTEATGDPPCNMWAADGQGRQVAKELADAVEMQTYPITLPGGKVVYVSNFVLPSFFTPNAPPPYDFISRNGPNVSPPPGPFQTAPGNGGNYQIVETEGKGEHQITAEHAPTHRAMVHGTPAKLAKRRHWSSRTYRRGVRL